MRKREDFCRVCEGHRTFSGTVECAEDVDEESYESYVGVVILWDEVAHSCSKERPAHIWEGEKQETAASERVNCPYSWPSEDEVYHFPQS